MPVLRQEPCVLHQAALYQVSRSFSVRVLRGRRELVDRVRRFVLVSAVPCIRRVPRRWDRVRSELVQAFHLRDPFVLVAVRVRPRAVGTRVAPRTKASRNAR